MTLMKMLQVPPSRLSLPLPMTWTLPVKSVPASAFLASASDVAVKIDFLTSVPPSPTNSDSAPVASSDEVLLSVQDTERGVQQTKGGGETEETFCHKYRRRNEIKLEK